MEVVREFKRSKEKEELLAKGIVPYEKDVYISIFSSDTKLILLQLDEHPEKSIQAMFCMYFFLKKNLWKELWTNNSISRAYG